MGRFGNSISKGWNVFSSKTKKLAINSKKFIQRKTGHFVSNPRRPVEENTENFSEQKPRPKSGPNSPKYRPQNDYKVDFKENKKKEEPDPYNRNFAEYESRERPDLGEGMGEGKFGEVQSAKTPAKPEEDEDEEVNFI